MTSTNQILKQFLHDQQKRLKEKTYRQYDSVIDIFEIYLNNYGFSHYISDEDLEKCERAGKSYTEVFGIDGLSSSNYSELFEYFLIRKTYSSQSFIKQSFTVIKKLTNWLYENKFIEEKQYAELKSYFEETDVNSHTNAIKASDLLYEYAQNTPDYDFTEMDDDYFTITKIKQNTLWVEAITEEIGPIKVTNEIASLLREDWVVSMQIGKYQNAWYIVEVGNVYPST